jgi:hypothetical protein
VCVCVCVCFFFFFLFLFSLYFCKETRKVNRTVSQNRRVRNEEERVHFMCIWLLCLHLHVHFIYFCIRIYSYSMSLFLCVLCVCVCVIVFRVMTHLSWCSALRFCAVCTDKEDPILHSRKISWEPRCVGPLRIAGPATTQNGEPLMVGTWNDMSFFFSLSLSLTHTID